MVMRPTVLSSSHLCHFRSQISRCFLSYSLHRLVADYFSYEIYLSSNLPGFKAVFCYAFAPLFVARRCTMSCHPLAGSNDHPAIQMTFQQRITIIRCLNSVASVISSYILCISLFFPLELPFYCPILPQSPWPRDAVITSPVPALGLFHNNNDTQPNQLCRLCPTYGVDNSLLNLVDLD
ncbi:hypothetical protein V8C42DRAFT_6437 [Trichoderma barbatum]